MTDPAADQIEEDAARRQHGAIEFLTVATAPSS
jgi:hypothetical protein